MSNHYDEDIEQPGDTVGSIPSIPRPTGIGNRTNTSGTNRTASIYFSKEDVNQTTPALPIASLVEELKKRHGEERYNKEYKECMEKADNNFDGLITVDELVMVIEMMHQMKHQNTGLKRVVCFGGLALIFVLLSIFLLCFAVVALTKEIQTGDNEGQPNALVSKHTGIIVDTHPSDGGGIYLQMAAFTEPVNITFPSYGKTQECVGQIPASSISSQYNRFTTGGSSLTIRYIDYSEDRQPVFFTEIPLDTLAVSGFRYNEDAAQSAWEGTQAIKETQVVFGDNGRRLEMMKEASRKLEMMKMEGAKTGDSEASQEKKARNDLSPPPPDDSNNEISTGGKSNQASKQKVYSRRRRNRNRNRRYLQDEEQQEDPEDEEKEDEEQLVTVGDYMDAFAEKTAILTFTKDQELLDDIYFVCRGDNAVAVN